MQREEGLSNKIMIDVCAFSHCVYLAEAVFRSSNEAYIFSLNEQNL